MDNLTKRPETIEFVVKRDFEENLPQILSNVAEVKEWAKKQTEIDRSLILQSEEDFAEARKRCATINKIIREIESNRKDTKKAYNAPYEVFEKALKEVEEILSTARENLWEQLTQAEKEKKAAKEAEYRAYYETQSAGAPWRLWVQIFDKTWLNNGKSPEVVKAEIDKIIEKINNDISAIKSINSEFVVTLIQRYKDGCDLSDVIAFNNRLIAEKQALESRKKEVEIEIPKIPEPKQEEKSEPNIITIDFRVHCSAAQLKSLGEYMRNNKIKYEKVPQKG